MTWLDRKETQMDEQAEQVALLTRLDTMEGAIRALESLRPTLAPLARCWECDGLVPDAQSRRSMAAFGAIICAWCEPWVRAVLHQEPERLEHACPEADAARQPR